MPLELSPAQIDIIYLALFGLAPILKLAAGAIIALGFLEGLVYALQVLRG